ncbi:hypothetical protein ACH5RR_031021 [Cinchona calisaya]|uniref:DELLA protein RGL1-like n=1 Tax=Cinchona calisaya TaxID=153742 RepID=A0ABD2YH39_9GENT
MSKKILTFERLDLGGVPDNVSSSKDSETAGAAKRKRRTQTHESSGGEDRGESGVSTDAFHSGRRFENQKENTAGQEGTNFLSKYQNEQQPRQFVDFGGFDNLYFDVLSPPFQSCPDEEIKKLIDLDREPKTSEIVETTEEVRPYEASLGILKNYGSRFRRLNGERINILSFGIENTGISRQKFSTPALLKLAGEKFIQSSDSTSIKNELSRLSHPYDASFLGLSEENMKDVQLVQHLLAAAEKVSEKQFHRAGKLLKKCNKLCFDKGNPVQRLVYYFSGALRERIDQETGRSRTSKGLGRKLIQCVENALSTVNSTILAFQKAVPFSLVSQFAGIQAIIEQVVDARKVHIIDLQIRLGMQYTMLIQALAARSECPVDRLKITAVATNCKEAIEATGKRLTSFAESFNLPFSFSVLMVEDILDLHESLFEIEDDEAVAVYSEYFLMLMIGRQDRLESLMAVIRNINPCIIVVTEVEANHNSPVFVNRFTEALFYYGAFFDAFEDCLKDDEPNRMVMESMFFSQGIKNIVAAEGEERTIRHVKINVWRTFFERFGMVEVELSMSSMYQAILVLKNFACGSSCTLNMDGKCLIVGWNGTPTNSLSAWIFE